MYLERARQAQDLFRDRIILDSWPEEKIAAAVHHRMEALEMRASFRDLVVGPLEGSELESAVLRTEGEYLRLLWDYAQGNPRVALHFWLHSLAPQDGELRVRLFQAPDIDSLEELHEQSRFLLAAVVVHENINEEEAAVTTGMKTRQCRALLAYLGSLGYLACDEDGHWRVTTHWYRAVIRYLRRKRLLFE
jgi:hypothetical protein